MDSFPDLDHPLGDGYQHSSLLSSDPLFSESFECGLTGPSIFEDFGLDFPPLTSSHDQVTLSSPQETVEKSTDLIQSSSPDSVRNDETHHSSQDASSAIADHPSEPKEDDEDYVAANTKAEDDDEEYLYKRARRSPQQYKKRKDVIFKTILRKSRRQLQDKFNALTNYFGERKGKGGEWLKTCLVKFAS